MTPKTVVAAFVMLINRGSVDAMASTMAEDHCFIDSLGHKVCGREAVRVAWIGYLAQVTGYSIAVDEWWTDGTTVIALGLARGSCRGTAWETPIACRAVVRGDELLEWRVYADNEPIRQLLR